MDRAVCRAFCLVALVPLRFCLPAVLKADFHDNLLSERTCCFFSLEFDRVITAKHTIINFFQFQRYH